MAERRDWAGERGDFATLTEAEVRGESYVGRRPLDGGPAGSACSYPYMLEEKRPDAPLFEGDYQKRFEKIVSRYPDPGGALLPALNLAQEIRGWLSPESMDRVAELLGLSPSYVRGVATFYTMYNKRPVGRHLIQVCTNVCCNVCGADQVFERFLEHARVEPGDISEDGLFTVIEAECLGACGFPTAVQINSRYYENVSAGDVPAILEDLRRRDARPIEPWRPDVPLHETSKDPATAVAPDAEEAGRGERRVPRDEAGSGIAKRPSERQDATQADGSTSDAPGLGRGGGQPGARPDGAGYTGASERKPEAGQGGGSDDRRPATDDRGGGEGRR